MDGGGMRLGGDGETSVGRSFYSCSVFIMLIERVFMM